MFEFPERTGGGHRAFYAGDIHLAGNVTVGDTPDTPDKYKENGKETHDFREGQVKGKRT